MNIFEALDAGIGRATLPGRGIDCFARRQTDVYGIECMKGGMRFTWVTTNWKSIAEVTYHELSSNDWIPYVPRETCSNCGQVITLPKTKHKEVFENVHWASGPYNQGGGFVIYPMSGMSKLYYSK